MTDTVPTWVASVLGIEGIGWDTPSPVCSLVSPLSSKEALSAPFHSVRVAIQRVEVALLYLKRVEWNTKPREKYWRGSPFTDYEGRIQIWDGPSFYCSRCHLTWWERCRECEREKARWLRAKKLAEDLTAVSRLQGKSIRFVTLTIPNVGEVTEGINRMKKMVKDLRRRVGFKRHVTGGSDFYEWTEKSDGTKNVHHHGLWIGDYWKHEHLTETWGEGHVWITAIRRGQKGTKRMVNYAVKYTSKQDALGIRARQRFGCLYGRAFAELESRLKQSDM